MKKQVYTAVLAAVLAGSMIGTSVSAEEGQTFTVGICQLVQHEALDAATQGFKDALTENFGDSVIFDEQNAQGDPNTCSTIINSFVSNGDSRKRNCFSPGSSRRNERNPDPRYFDHRVRRRA